jgi:hypothetical protein
MYNSFSTISVKVAGISMYFTELHSLETLLRNPAKTPPRRLQTSEMKQASRQATMIYREINV